MSFSKRKINKIASILTHQNSEIFYIICLKIALIYSESIKYVPIQI